jgi:hypothetical protein
MLSDSVIGSLYTLYANYHSYGIYIAKGMKSQSFVAKRYALYARAIDVALSACPVSSESAL